MKSGIALLFLLAGRAFGGGETQLATLEMEPGPNMTRAELHYVKPMLSPRAALVLIPGVNGNGRELILSPSWQEFAKEHRLALLGLSFASPMNAIHDGSGYYYASKGSGDILLEGIRKIYGRDLSLILYGFSGGAHFASRFEEWMPKRVIAWCAYSAGWWDLPSKNSVAPPGIVACGEDDPRYGASIVYFKQGRAAGKPWLWISLPRTGHSSSFVLDSFVANYFSAVLSRHNEKTVWVDVDLEKVISPEEASKVPSQTAWLPSDSLFEAWSEIHEP
ncbi:MAG TPA: hypothetical protein VIT23_12415 [Terrimicrobiaceae bacterium]